MINVRKQLSFEKGMDWCLPETIRSVDVGHPIQNKKFQFKKKIMEDLMPLFAADSLAPHTHIHGYKMSKVSFTGQLLQKNRQ